MIGAPHASLNPGFSWFWERRLYFLFAGVGVPFRNHSTYVKTSSVLNDMCCFKGLKKVTLVMVVIVVMLKGNVEVHMGYLSRYDQMDTDRTHGFAPVADCGVMA